MADYDARGDDDGYEVPASVPVLAKDPWPPKLPFDIALGIWSVDEVLEQNGIARSEYEAYAAKPAFLLALAMAEREVREKGSGFKIKAKVQAEEYLVTAHQMIHDPKIPANVRADLIKAIVKWGFPELEQKQPAVTVNNSNSQTGSFTFSWAGSQPQDARVVNED